MTSPSSAVDPARTASDEPARPTVSKALRRINDVAAEVGLTTRAIRYYEEQGLLTPSARSSGAYRLYDADDVERLRTIKAFRDDAGFSVAEIASLLADESARQRNKAAFVAATDQAERRVIVVDALARLERQLDLLGSKIQRLNEMRNDVAARADRAQARLAELDGSR